MSRCLADASLGIVVHTAKDGIRFRNLLYRERRNCYNYLGVVKKPCNFQYFPGDFTRRLPCRLLALVQDFWKDQIRFSEFTTIVLARCWPRSTYNCAALPSAITIPDYFAVTHASSDVCAWNSRVFSGNRAILIFLCFLIYWSGSKVSCGRDFFWLMYRDEYPDSLLHNLLVGMYCKRDFLL